MEEIIKRLERLESKEEIRELVSKYAEACDQQDLESLARLFTEDAEFDSPNGMLKSKGRQNIIDMYLEVFKSRGPSFHWTHDVRVEIDSKKRDFATGVVYSHAETTRDGIVSLAAMRYDDNYSKEDGVWKFRKRVIHFFYYVKTKEYIETLASPLRVGMGETNVAADIPESVPAWIEFQNKYKNEKK
jgi:uncharacterized protein (TIGR02246 family)